MRYVLLTNNGLQHISLEQLKFHTQVKGWYCRAGDSVYNFLLDEKVHIANTICRKLQDFPVTDFSAPGVLFKKDSYLCPMENCFCGMDIGIPKGISLQAIKDLETSYSALSEQERDQLPYFNESSPILAFGLADFLLQKITHIDFFLGKRCNFDCTYCSPTIHDNVSPFPSQEKLDQAYSFLVNTVKKNDSSWQSKKWNFIFHGGEPTIIPSYLDFVKKISQEPHFKTDITTLTNLSRQTPYLLELNQYSKIIFSVHLQYFNEAFLKKACAFFEQRTSKHQDILVKILYQKKYKEKIDQVIEFVRRFDNLFLAIGPLHNKIDKKLIAYDAEDKEYFKIVHPN